MLKRTGLLKFDTKGAKPVRCKSAMSAMALH